jgi:hypothetical protein
MNARLLGLLLATAALTPACGPADFTGEYTINYTNAENGCSLSNWTVGASTTGIPVTITQTGSDVTATVGGLMAIYLDLTLGGHIFKGGATLNQVSLKLPGKVAQSKGACAYTWNLELQGHLEGDALSGTLLYTADTNASADCGVLAGCQSLMSFNGTRPPKAK